MPSPSTDAASHDPVNHPKHYTSHPSGVECIDITRHMSFNVGNAIKYLWRADEKGNAIQDLEKAAWYVMDEICKRKGVKHKNPDDFKKWVHTFLDFLGVPTFDGTDCRVGMRLAHLCQQAMYDSNDVKLARAAANDAIGVKTKPDTFIPKPEATEPKKYRCPKCDVLVDIFAITTHSHRNGVLCNPDNPYRVHRHCGAEVTVQV